MRTSVSHLAFNENTADLLSKLPALGISNLEVVLSKIRVDDFSDFIKSANSAGLSVESAQSILWNSGVSDLTEDSFASYMLSMIPVYESLGVKTLVLGSPLQRQYENFEKLSSQFFKIDSALASAGLTLCIEPNSRNYGGKYFFDVSSIVKFIESCNLSNVKTMIDTHNLILEGLDPVDQLISYSSKVHHIHVSEVGLEGFIESDRHSDLARAINSIKYSGIVTYEVLNSKNLLLEILNFTKCFVKNNSNK